MDCQYVFTCSRWKTAAEMLWTLSTVCSGFAGSSLFTTTSLYRFICHWTAGSSDYNTKINHLKKRLIKKSTRNQQFYYLNYWNQSYLVLEMEILTQMLLHLIICVFLWRDMQCVVSKIFLHLIKTSDYLCNAKEGTPAWEKCTYERKCQSMMTAVLMGKKKTKLTDHLSSS